MHAFKKATFVILLVALVAGTLPGCASMESNAQSMADEGFVEVNGARIHYQMQGEGPAMMLVHGYPLSGDLFSEQRAALSDDYQVITVDLRGYGRSEAPGDEPEAGVETYASDVLAVMDELGVEEAIIGGMSMGGPIVLSMYRQAPNRFMAMLLIDTIAAAANPIEAGTWRGAAEVIRNQGVEALPPLVIDEMLTGQARMERMALAESLTAMMNEASTQAALAGAEALASRPNFQPMLSEIDVPTLILVGLQDTIYPFEIARRMDRMIPTSEVVVIDNASHAAIIEEADRANEAIRDWAGRVM